MTDSEVLQALKDVMKPISSKLEDIELTLESMRLENKMEHRAIRKDIDYLNDEMEVSSKLIRKSVRYTII